MEAITMKKIIYMLNIFALTLAMSACNGMNSKSEDIEHNEENAEEASVTDKSNRQMIDVDLKSSEGERVGVAYLSQQEDGVNIQIEAWNLPEGSHGFHIHEKGICEEPDFESAGGHFNPTNAKHGFDNPEGPHAGDLPNLVIGEDEKVKASFLAKMVTLKKGENNSLLKEGGTSLVIHSDPDDYISQPAGDAGERIACGVILD